MYESRKNHQINILTNEIKLLRVTMKFINDVIHETIKIYKQSKSSIIESLQSHQFPFYENQILSDYNESIKITTEYNYLLNMSIYNFTSDKINEIEDKINKKSNELTTLQETSIKDMWIRELDSFEEEYKKMK